MTFSLNIRITGRLLDYLFTAALLACFVAAAGWHFAGNHVSKAAISTANRLIRRTVIRLWTN